MTKNEILKKLKGKKTIKIFKIKRWTSVGASTMYVKDAGWEVQPRAFFYKKDALVQFAKDKEFYTKHGTIPFKSEIISKVVDVDTLTIKQY